MPNSRIFGFIRIRNPRNDKPKNISNTVGGDAETQKKAVGVGDRNDAHKISKAVGDDAGAQKLTETKGDESPSEAATGSAGHNNNEAHAMIAKVVVDECHKDPGPSFSSSIVAVPGFYETFFQETTENVNFAYTVDDVPSFSNCLRRIRESGPMKTKLIPIDFKSASTSCQGHTFSLQVSEFTSMFGQELQVKAQGDLKGHNKDVNEVLVLEKLQLDLKNSEGRVIVSKLSSCLLFSDETFSKSFIFTSDSWGHVVKSFTFTISGRVKYKILKPEVVHGLSTTQALGTVSRPEFVIGKLHGLLFSDVNSDVLIKCDGETFPAHRFILALMSPVFSAMMTTDMKENRNNVIVMKETSSSVCKEMLRFMYTGSVDTTNWPMEFTQELCKNADMYDVTALKTVCEQKLASLITVDNVGQLYMWTRLHQLDNVRQVAKNFIVVNKKSVLKVLGVEQAKLLLPDIDIVSIWV